MSGMLYSIEETLMPWSGLLTGVFGVGAISAFRADAQIRAEIMTYLAGSGLLGLVLWWQLDSLPLSQGMFWGACFLAGLGLMLFWYRYGVQRLDRMMASLTIRSQLARQARTDVRDLARVLPPARAEYDARRYYKSDRFFVGVNEEGMPVYWQGRLPHVAVVGTTGSGKGRKLQDLAAQSIRMGEALIYLDPKDDEWGPHALYAACQEASKPYHYVRLLPQSPAQFNLLAEAEAWEVEELLSAALDLGDKGKGSDFYMTKNRVAAKAAARRAAEGKLTLAEVYREMASDESWQENAPGFLDKLGELATLPAINANGSALSLQTLINEGGGLYVVGSMTLQAVRRAQQMIFVRAQQIASARDRMAGSLRTVCVIADETKYHVSRPVLQGLGASRDKGMRVVLAFQSFTDLRDCPDDMNPDMVVGAVIENTPCKLVYKLEDPDTAEWLARKSGIILVDDETRVLGRNAVLSETTQWERTVRQGEHYLIDINKLQNLPAGWGVLYGQGLAQPCYVSPYRVDKCTEAITPQAVAPSPDVTNIDQSQPNHMTRGQDFFDMEV